MPSRLNYLDLFSSTVLKGNKPSEQQSLLDVNLMARSALKSGRSVSKTLSV